MRYSIPCLIALFWLGPATLTAQLADKKALNHQSVEAAMHGAMHHAMNNGWAASIAVVDDHGELLAFHRLDGASFASIDIAQAKARTAARFRRPTKALGDAIAEGRIALLSVDGVMALQGGVPIVVNGVTVGAIGVSGVTSEQDEQVAMAGAAAVKP
jgi:uncharacterized protein GlcG (DUF336 family)